MKNKFKFLALAIMALLSVNVWSYTIDYTCANTTTVTLNTSGNCTGSTCGWTYSAKTWSSPQLRLAAGAVITFNFSGIEVTKIEMGVSSSGYNGGTWTCSTGACSGDGTSAIWEGSCSSTMTLSPGGSGARLKTFKITYTCASSCTAPTITKDLSETEVTYTKGATATALSITATGTSVTYQWYSNTSKSTSGATTLTGQTSSSYTPSTTTTGTKYYYCVASSSTCTTTSKFATITVTAPKYTVTFNAGSGTCSTSSSTESTAGAGVNLPVASPSSACGTDGWTFAGWATASQAETTTAPTLYAANSNYKPSSNCTLYAVYSKTESGSGPTKWMVATSIAAGDVVVISTNQSYTDQTMKTAGTISSSLMGCFASTYNSDKSEITSLASGTLQFTIGGNSTSGYTLKNGDNYLGMSGDKKVALSTTSSTWSISFSGTTATVSQLYTPTGKSEGNYSLQYNYNNSSDRFTGYTSSQVAVSLYKKSSGTTTYNSNPSCATCTNLITITKGTPFHGSFTLTGAGTDICADEPVTVNLSNITADTHYHATAVTTSATTGGGTPSAITDGLASVSGITASTTINVTFAEDIKVVVTLLNNNNPVNAGGFDAEGKKEYYTGETLGALPTLTSAEACDATSVTFRGWTTEQITTKRAAAPVFVNASTPVTGNMTLRAVWARAE